MILPVYLIRNRLTEQCSPLFIVQNEELAKRQFIDFCSNTDNPNHVIDEYILYKVGVFDQENVSLNGLHNADHQIIMDGYEVENILRFREARKKAEVPCSSEKAE